MFKKFFLTYEIVITLCWIAGIFVTGNLKSFFWAFPAGYAIGTIFSKWVFKRNSIDLPFEIPDDAIKVFDSRDKNVPPEMKATMEKMIKLLKESGQIPEDMEKKKCEDPHCPACWGLADKDETKI